MGGLQSVRKASSAYGLPSAPERRECKSRVTLLLRDADSGQIDHMAAEPTHGPHHPCSSSSWLGAKGPFLAIVNLFLHGGSMKLRYSQCSLDASPAPRSRGGAIRKLVWGPEAPKKYPGTHKSTGTQKYPHARHGIPSWHLHRMCERRRIRPKTRQALRRKAIKP